MELFEALSIRRKEIGMKYEELSEKSGVPVNTLKKVFTGAVSAPSFENVRAIAYAMDISLADLDSRIAEEQAPTEDEKAILRKFRSLDDSGKSVVLAVLESQVKRIEEFGPARKRKTIPIINGILDGTIEMKYAAKQEQKELQKESTANLANQEV